MQGLKTVSLTLPASLSAIYEYPRKIFCRLPSCKKVPCYPTYVVCLSRIIAYIKDKGCELLLISKDEFISSSHQADLEFSAQASKRSQQDSIHQTQNLGIIESFRLEKTSEITKIINLALPSLPLDHVPSSTSTQLLNISSDGDSHLQQYNVPLR